MQNEQKEKQSQSKAIDLVREYFKKHKKFLLLIISIAIVSILTNQFALGVMKVRGQSMSPNILSERIILVDKLSILFHKEFKRGDVVVFHYNGGELFIKRIIALPEDRILLKEGKIIVNGNLVDEYYLSPSLLTSPGTFLKEGQEQTVSKDTLFVMGDNRGESLDSRDARIGFVKFDNVVGKYLGG